MKNRERERERERESKKPTFFRRNRGERRGCEELLLQEVGERGKEREKVGEREGRGERKSGREKVKEREKREIVLLPLWLKFSS